MKLPPFVTLGGTNPVISACLRPCLLCQWHGNGRSTGRDRREPPNARTVLSGKRGGPSCWARSGTFWRRSVGRDPARPGPCPRHHRSILVALLLLFTKLKQAIESASSDEVRYGVREFFLFIGIGGWLGFIVLDGATYLLLALTLAVGLPLVQANAVKNAVAVPVTIIAMLVFASRVASTGRSVR
jgi:hypothetical protein